MVTAVPDLADSSGIFAGYLCHSFALCPINNAIYLAIGLAAFYIPELTGYISIIWLPARLDSGCEKQAGLRLSRVCLGEEEMTVNENQKRILQMLSEGKISVEEASRLLSLINQDQAHNNRDDSAFEKVKSSPKYLYIRVDPKETPDKEGRQCVKRPGKANVRIPMGLIRAGIKLKALIPTNVADDINKSFKEKGIGFDIRNIKDEDLESLVIALGESEINIDSEEAEVHIHAE